MKKILTILLALVVGTIFAQSFANASDFVAGSTSIFNDQLASDKIGEFPSGWTFGKGVIETVLFENIKTIEYKKGGSLMEPALKPFDYLPQDFSVEFDYYLSDMTQRGYYLSLYTGQRDYERLEIRGTRLQMGKAKGEIDRKSFVPGWKRFSLSYQNGTLKGYVNGERILNYPSLNVKFAKLTLAASDGDQYFIRNFRIGSYSGKETAIEAQVPQQEVRQPVVTKQEISKPVLMEQPIAISRTGISAGTGAGNNLTIVKAWWGSHIDSDRIDVTEFLNKKIMFGKLTAIATNAYFGANFGKNEEKNLYIRYSTPAGEYEITVLEGEKVTVPDINKHRKAK